MADSRRGGHHGTSGRQFNDDTYNAFERALGFAAGNDPPLVGHATNESAAADVSTGALLPPPSIRARSASLGSRRANTYIAADGSTGALIPPPSHRPRTMSLSSRRANFTPLPGTNLFLLFLYAFSSICFLIREGKSHICQDVSPRTRGRIVRRSQLRRRQQHVHAPVRHRWHRVALLKEGHRYKFFFFCFFMLLLQSAFSPGIMFPLPLESVAGSSGAGNDPPLVYGRHQCNDLSLVSSNEDLSLLSSNADESHLYSAARRVSADGSSTDARNFIAREVNVVPTLNVVRAVNLPYDFPSTSTSSTTSSRRPSYTVRGNGTISFLFIRCLSFNMFS